jgi:hypothetical protein
MRKASCTFYDEEPLSSVRVSLDPFHKQIREYLQLNIPLRRISTIINPQLENGLAYSSYQYFVQQDDELLALWQAQRQG